MFLQHYSMPHFFGYYAANGTQAKNKEAAHVKFLDICEHFFITHPPLGQKEGHESERIMFFWPPSHSMSKQTEITGMAEAIVSFSAFLPFQPQQTGESEKAECKQEKQNGIEYRYVTSANSKEVILVLEDGKFTIGTSISRRHCKEFDYCLHQPTIKSLLERCYQAYKLFYGPFGTLFGADRDFFKSNLERFFMPHLQLLRLNKTPLVDLFSGVDFLPLDSSIFLEVHCLMTNCQEEFPCIEKTMFLYQERLIQYSVEKRDLIPLWHFLNETLVPCAMQAELSPESRRSSHGNGRSGFLVDDQVVIDFLGELSAHRFPKVFISDETGAYAAYDLLAYRVLNATACFFIKSDNFPEPQSTSSTQSEHPFLAQLCTFLDAPMAAIASKIGDKFLGDSLGKFQPEIPYHFIYFNPDSMSLRKSFPGGTVVSAQSVGIIGVGAELQVLPANIYRLIYESYDKFISDSSLLGQLYLKADNDWWIVFKRVERRILALFLPQSAASTIVEIQSTVEGILKSRFPNLFIS